MAQEHDCKKVSKKTDATKTEFRGPYGKYVEVVKQYKIDTFFGLQLHYNDLYEHFDRYGVSVELENGEKIVDEDAPVYCRQERSTVYSAMGGATSPMGGEYRLEGYLRIDAERMNKLSQHKITAIHLHTTSKAVPKKEAAMVMKYVQCVAEAE